MRWKCRKDDGNCDCERTADPETRISLEPGMLMAVRSDQWSLRLRARGRKHAFSLTCFVQDSLKPTAQSASMRDPLSTSFPRAVAR
eukprot:s3201_g11.t1